MKLTKLISCVYANKNHAVYNSLAVLTAITIVLWPEIIYHLLPQITLNVKFNQNLMIFIQYLGSKKAT